MPGNKRPRKNAAGARARKPAGPGLPPLPDRRMMEGVMARMLGSGAVDDALGRAQDLIYDAFDAPTAKRRIVLALKALEISPLCADAYVLLAEHAAPQMSGERLELYRRAVEAGELALGKVAFEEDVGHFWGLLETRPYMRARCGGIAQMLWASGRHEEAVAHYRDLLRLNPNDNQGVRSTCSRHATWSSAATTTWRRCSARIRRTAQRPGPTPRRWRLSAAAATTI